MPTVFLQDGYGEPLTVREVADKELVMLIDCPHCGRGSQRRVCDLEIGG